MITNELQVGKKYKLVKQSRKKDPEMLAMLAVSGIVNKDNAHQFEDGIPYFPPSKMVEGDSFNVTGLTVEEEFLIETSKGESLVYRKGFKADQFEFELINNHLKEV